MGLIIQLQMLVEDRSIRQSFLIYQLMTGKTIKRLLYKCYSISAIKFHNFSQPMKLMQLLQIVTMEKEGQGPFLFKTSEIAMDFYAKKRFQIDEGYGVTQPCQIQYIRYFQKVLKNPNKRPQIIALTKVIFRGPTKYADLYVKVKNFTGETIVTTKKSESKTSFQKTINEKEVAEQILTLSEQKFFFGDCKILIKSPSTFSSLTVANYSFNTAFVEGGNHIIPFEQLSPYSLRKSDTFGKQFQIQLQFKYLCGCSSDVIYNERCQLCKQMFTKEEQKWSLIRDIVTRRNAIEQTKREGMLGYHIVRQTTNLRLLFGDRIDQYRILKLDKQTEIKSRQTKLLKVENEQKQEQKQKN